MTTGKRFANYLIDLISSRFILLIILPLAWPHGLKWVARFTGPGLPLQCAWESIIYILYAPLMGLVEWSTGGRSLGKYLTGTRVVNLDGSRIKLKTSMFRNLVRLVPFEPLSIFGKNRSLWHDRWSDTRVLTVKPVQPE
jgi:uncharacterized RDD family membrane protein YckC